MEEPKCKIDGTPMKPGIALLNTWFSTDDFGGDAYTHGATISRRGAPVVVNVHKCPTCGRSIKKGVAND